MKIEFKTHEIVAVFEGDGLRLELRPINVEDLTTDELQKIIGHRTDIGAFLETVRSRWATLVVDLNSKNDAAGPRGES